jgi:ferredoxin
VDLGGVTPEEIRALYGDGEPNGQSLSAMIKDDEKCIRCGLCALRCPTDAMTMEVFFYEESEAVGKSCGA